MGLGVTPWYPLLFGILCGKYTRENLKTTQPSRGEMVTMLLTDQAFRVLDQLRKVAADLGTTPARAALAWLLSRPAVTSPIIGARTAEILYDNIGAVDVSLSPEHIVALDEVSKPALNFPADFLQGVVNFARAGVTLNGQTFPVPTPFLPTGDDECY